MLKTCGALVGKQRSHIRCPKPAETSEKRVCHTALCRRLIEMSGGGGGSSSGLEL